MDSLWKRSFVLRHHSRASEYIFKAKNPNSGQKFTTLRSRVIKWRSRIYSMPPFETVSRRVKSGWFEPVVIQIQIDFSFLMILRFFLKLLYEFNFTCQMRKFTWSMFSKTLYSQVVNLLAPNHGTSGPLMPSIDTLVVFLTIK